MPQNQPKSRTVHNREALVKAQDERGPCGLGSGESV